MSLDATNWAWRVEVDSMAQRVVLLSLADRAGEDHTCYPSQKRLAKDCCANIKTIGKVLSELERKNLIKDTGKIKGNGVKIYQLIGVTGREDELSTSPKNGTSTKSGTCTKNGMTTTPKNGIATSTVFGVQNLPMNLPIESKNKKTWICFKKLREEIFYADSEIDFTGLIMSSWFEREIQAFENHNENKPMSDAVKIYHFADWLLNAKQKYDRRQQQANLEQAKAQTPQKMSDKQLFMFAQKLAHHSEFSGRYGTPGQSYEQLASWVAVRLSNPKHLEEWARYLKEVGFTGKLGVAA